MSQDAEICLKALAPFHGFTEQLSSYIYGRISPAKTVTKK
jgi:hypothetical protein